MKLEKNQHKFYEDIEACRLCCSKNLQSLLDLGDQPPANSLRKNPSDMIPSAPLKIIRCNDCSAIQLSSTVDPTYLFNKYVWVTATSKTARQYSEAYYLEVMKRCKDKLPFVVEVASNDGTFLKQFKENGCKILGVDPAKNIAENANSDGIPTIAEFFDESIAKKILRDYERPNLVMARNVIPHVKEIHSIIKGMAHLVDENGLIAIEFHYAKKIMEELHYDSIYHEHLFYFSIKSLSELLRQYKLYPFDAFLSPISGGSLVLFFSKEKKGCSDTLKKLISEEEKAKLNELDAWQTFSSQSKLHALHLKKLVLEYANKNSLVAYGASARSATLMNFAGLTTKEIDCIIDRNPIKQGLYSPSSNMPIVSYDQGLERAIGRDILLLAWNFEEEVIQDLRKSGFQGSIIIPLPNEVRVR